MPTLRYLFFIVSKCGSSVRYQKLVEIPRSHFEIANGEVRSISASSSCVTPDTSRAYNAVGTGNTVPVNK